MRNVYFNGQDWNLVVYFARWVARMLSSHPCFTECLYLWGSAGAGKDALVSSLVAFLGDGRTEYVNTENGAWLAAATRRDREAASPKLMAMKGARLLLFSEVPEHSGLNTSDLRPLTEQMGSMIAGRDNYSGPSPFHPMGAVLSTSNYAATVQNTDDPGTERRLKQWFMSLPTAAEGEKKRAAGEEGEH